MLKLNKYDIEFVVRRLREFAAGAGIAGPLETYVVYGASLVPQREVVKDAALVMRVLSRHRQAITVQLPFLARRIQVKSNARVFGIRSMNGLTAKVALAEQRVGLSFRRDMTARRIVEPHLSDRLRVPLIHKRDRRGARWLIEELVEDTHAGDSELMRLVAEHGGELYGFSARVRPLIRSEKTRRIVRALRLLLKEIVPPCADFPDDSKWLVGLCHGDLNRDNLLCAEDGRLWLIDWERAGVIPLAQDLGRLYVIDPKLKSAILDLLGSLDPAREALSPVHQLALGAAFELFKHIRSRAWCLDYEMSAKGRTLEEAAAIVDRRAMEARAALADVAG